MRCAVIGGGPAGSLATSFLALSSKNKWNVTIFERQTKQSVEHPAGAGLLLQPAAIEVLDKIGAAEGIIKDGHIVEKLVGNNSLGWEVMDLDYRTLGNEFFGVGINRHTLSYHLRHSWDNNSNITVKYNTPITEISSITQKNDNYSKEVCLIDKNGEKYGPFDLVIVSTGRNCSLREKELVTTDKRYPWGAFWSIVPLLDHPEISNRNLQQYYKDTSIMLGFLPSGKFPNDDKELISIFWSAHENKRQEFINNDLDAWKEQVRKLTPSHAVLLDSITSMDQVTWAEYSDVSLKQYHSSKAPVVYIGDCGHATSPQLGMGVTASCLDAAVLFNSLENSNSIQEALPKFTTIRKPTVRFYQTFSRILTPLFQSNLGMLVSGVRDISLMVPNHLPWFSTQTALTLCGYKKGLLTANKPNFPTNTANKAIPKNTSI